MADFFFTPIHRTDDIQQTYPDEPSIQRYQTFSEFNKLRYKDSPSTPSVPRVRSEPSATGYFTSNHAVLDIRPEEPKKGYHDVSCQVTSDIGSRYIGGSVSSSRQVDYGTQSNAFRSDYFTVTRPEPTHRVYSSNHEAEPSISDSLAADTRTPYSYSPYSQTPLETLHQQPYRQPPFTSPGDLEKQIRYPYTSYGTGETYLQTRKSDPAYSYATPFQELYSNYPGPLTPKYGNQTSYLPHPYLNTGAQPIYPYSNHSPSTASPSAKPYKYSAAGVKKSNPKKARETKPKPALSEYSPDVQALLGTQSSDQHARYPRYGISSRRL